jgi:hypothetical protein
LCPGEGLPFFDIHRIDVSRAPAPEPAFIERIEDAARREAAAFRALLESVWQSSTPEIWARVTALRR